MPPKPSNAEVSGSNASKITRPEGLGFVLYTLIWAGESLRRQVEEEDDDDDEDDEDEDEDAAAIPLPPALRVFVDKHFPPLWESDCPENQAQWEEHWKDLRAKFPREKEYSNEELKAKWGRSDAERFFTEQAVTHGWLTVLDKLITADLESRGQSFQAYFSDEGFTTGRQAGKYPGVDLWSGVKTEVLRTLFTPDLVAAVVPQPLGIWWGYVMSKYVEREKATAQRQRNKYETLVQKVTKLLGGENFLMGTDDAARNFNARECVQAIKLLRQCSETLGWEVLSKPDEKLLRTKLTSVTTASIAEFDARLTEGAKRHEFVSRVLGWMTKMLAIHGSRSQVAAGLEDELEEYHREGYARGHELASSWSERHQLMVSKVEAVDVELFQDELQGFVNDWQSRDHNAIDEDVMRLLTGEDPERGLSDWLEGGADLGVDSEHKLTQEQLEELLGIVEGRFPMFRKHVAPHWTDYGDSDKDEEIADKTSVFSLRHHQLVAIVAILNRAVNPVSLSTWPPRQAALPDAAPQALREYWGCLPGHWLADAVGLGKTLTCAGLIAAVMHLYAFTHSPQAEGRAMPRILGQAPFKFGPCGEIPNAAHIVVVPGSLLTQWGDQLKRVFRLHAVSINVIRPNRKYWDKDMEVSGNRSPVNTIFVIGIMTIVRMGKAAGVTGSPPTFRTSLEGSTVFNRSFAVCIADEAHEFRKGSAAQQAMWALRELCLITVLASATPLIEGLADVHQQARIIRPAGLTMAVDSTLMTQLRLVNKIRGKNQVDRAVDLQAFMGATTTAAAALPTIGANTQETDGDTVLAPLEKAHKRGVLRLKTICLTNTIRRTGQSKNLDGSTLAGALPTSTFLHVIFNTEEVEVQRSKAMEESNVTEGKLDSARRVDAFYNDARKYLSYPPGKASSSRSRVLTLDNRQPGQPLSKLSTLSELLIKCLRDGPDTVVGVEHHGTHTGIITASRLGLPDVAVAEYKPNKLGEGEGATEKAVVFTQYAQFHGEMKAYLESAGISVDTVNGAMGAKTRYEAIEAFRAGSKRCLIISNVGGVGVDLTFARILVIYEQLWSAVMTHQLLGRIDREGQERETFSFSLAGKDTIDMLLMLMALRKAEVAREYISLERRKEFYKTYGALLADGDEPEATDDEDEELEQSLVAALKKSRKKVDPQSAKPATEKVKKRAKSTRDEGEADTDGSAKESEKKKGKKRAKPTPDEGEADNDGSGEVKSPKSNEQQPGPNADDGEAMDVDSDPDLPLAQKTRPVTRSRAAGKPSATAKSKGRAPKSKSAAKSKKKKASGSGVASGSGAQ